MFILAFRPISCLLGLSSLVLFCPPTASSDKIELTSDRPNRHDMGLKAKINYIIAIQQSHDPIQRNSLVESMRKVNHIFSGITGFCDTT